MTVVLGVLVAAVVAYDLIFWAKLDHADAHAEQHAADRTAAVSDAPAQAERAAALMTDDYARSYRTTVDRLLAAPADQVKAQVTAAVKDSGVVRVRPGEVEVLLFVDQTSATTLRAEPQTALNRVVMTMVERDASWLVDEITAL